MAYKFKNVIKNYFPLHGASCITRYFIDIPFCISTSYYVSTIFIQSLIESYFYLNDSSDSKVKFENYLLSSHFRGSFLVKLVNSPSGIMFHILFV